MSIAAAVLAAGRSTRMRNPKALLDFRGKPFVVTVLEALEALDIKHRVVVLGVDAPRIRPRLAGHACILVENLDADSGPIGSLRAALAALKPVRPTGVLVWPVDVPHVRLATVERLMATRERTAAPVVLPTFAGRRGHPVIWGESLFAELEASPAATRDGARALVHAYADQIAAVPVDDPAVIDDIDTPDDYERLIRSINREI
jgi:CTP:molybdopterin cytidylyltransferase MocA